jgi:microcystin-dependent protein
MPDVTVIINEEVQSTTVTIQEVNYELLISQEFIEENTTITIDQAINLIGQSGVTETVVVVSNQQGPQGATGLTGPQGPTGADSTVPGPQGPIGETGPQGEQGIQGIQGIQGVQGDTGPQGSTGDTGPQGIQGIQGIQGVQGEIGPEGPQGEQGEKGDTGDIGPTGPDGNPVGTINLYSGSTAPTGYLLCDGSAVSRTTYSALFSVTSTLYGVGDGSTTFNIPDLRDKFAIGTSGTRALASTGGASSYTLTVSNIPQHSHSIDHDHNSFTSGAGSAHSHTDTLTAPAHTHTTNINHGHANTLAAPAHTHSTPALSGAFTSGNQSVGHTHTFSGTTATDSHNHSTNTAGDASNFLSGSTVNMRYTNTTDPTLNTTSDTHSHTYSGTTSNISANHVHATTVSFAANTSGGASATALTGSITNLVSTVTSSGASATALTGSIDNESAHTHLIDVPAFTGTSGNYGTASPTAIDIIPPYLSLNYIIKAQEL